MDLFKNIDITGLAALISVVYIIIKYVRDRPSEEASQDASTSRGYADSARIANERADRMAERIEILEKDMERLKKFAQKETKEKAEYLAMLSDWARGITLLLYQMKTADMTAVWVPKQEDIHRFLKEGEENG